MVTGCVVAQALAAPAVLLAAAGSAAAAAQVEVAARVEAAAQAAVVAWQAAVAVLAAPEQARTHATEWSVNVCMCRSQVVGFAAPTGQ